MGIDTDKIVLLFAWSVSLMAHDRISGVENTNHDLIFDGHKYCVNLRYKPPFTPGKNSSKYT
mgnify:CR=1 FL=1